MTASEYNLWNPSVTSNYDPPTKLAKEFGHSVLSISKAPLLCTVQREASRHRTRWSSCPHLSIRRLPINEEIDINVRESWVTNRKGNRAKGQGRCELEVGMVVSRWAETSDGGDLIR